MVIALGRGIKQPYARSSPSTPPPLLPRQSPGAKGGQADVGVIPASKPGGEGGPSISLWFYDLPKRQVDSFADREFGFRNRVLPVLLHRSGHND
jgi:hypothetical protein